MPKNIDLPIPKILFTTSSFNLDNFIERHSVEKAGYKLVFNPYGKRLTESQLKEIIDDRVIGMVAGVEPITADVLKHSKLLKVISRCGVGMDNVDIETAQSLGITVFNTPDAPTIAVAELTIAHIISLARRVCESDRAIRKDKWKPLMGSLLAKQIVGVIGFGRIGQAVAHLLRAFQARVLIHDVLPAKLDDSIKLVGLEELLSSSDIITLHVPYMHDTHHLINTERIALMKPTALLINVARGGLIDEVALFTALYENRLGGAALDCFEQEPYKGPLLALENVQMTAHMGSYAREARDMMEQEACINLVRGLKQQGLL